MASSENQDSNIALDKLQLKNPIYFVQTHQNGPTLVLDQNSPENLEFLQINPLKSPASAQIQALNTEAPQKFTEQLIKNQQNQNQQLELQEEVNLNGKKQEEKFFKKSSQIRFEAQNCTEKIVLSPSGLMVQPSVSEKQQLAVANVCLEEGQHYFEIVCTFSCENIEIGLVKKGYSLEDLEKNEYVVQKFKTSTSRTVGILVDFDNNKLQWWLNGNYQKQREQSIPQGSWYLSVQIKDTGNCVILNPNAQRPDSLQKNYIQMHNISDQKKQLLGQKLTEEQEKEIANSLKTLEDNLSNFSEQKSESKKFQKALNFHFLGKSGNLLLQKENKLKLLRKSKNGLYKINSTLFVNKPSSLNSNILLLLKKNSVFALFKSLDLNQLLHKNINLQKFQNFLNSLNSANLDADNQQLEICIQFQDACEFIIAASEHLGQQIQEMEFLLLSHENLINQNQKQNQYQNQTVLQIEEQKSQKIEHDVYKHNEKSQCAFLNSKITLEDLYKALGTVNNLNEQLFAMSDNQPQLLEAFNNNHNRLFSTFYRLGTFIGNTNQRLDLIELSENGLFNEFDCMNQLKHFEQQNIQLEDIQNDKNEIQVTGLNLLKQIPESRHLQSISSANVEIDTFINSLPYQEHISQKPVSLLVNPNSNLISSYDTEGSLNFWNTQLSLQNIGNTDFKKPFIQLSKKQIEGEQTDKIESQMLGFDEPYLFKLIENSISDSIWVIEKPIQQIEKEQKSQPETQASSELVDQLVMMGFPPHISQLAVLKTNNKGVQDAMDIIFDIQAEEDKKCSTEAQIKPIWNCSACTLENEAPSKKCNVCETPAPKDAYFTQAEMRKIQEQKNKSLREQEQKMKQQQLEQQRLKEEQEKEQRRLKEEEIQKKIDQQIQFGKCANFLKPVQIDLQLSKMCPLIAAGVLNSESQNLSQIKFRRMGYNPRFLKQFYKPCKNGFICTLNNEWIIDPSIQSIENTLFGNKNNQLVVETLNRLYFQDETQQFLEVSEQIISIEGEQVIDVSWSQSSLQKDTKQETIFVYILTNKNLIIYELSANISDPYNSENNMQLAELQKFPLQAEKVTQQTKIFVSQSHETKEILILNENHFFYFDLNTKNFTQQQNYTENSSLVSYNLLNCSQISLLLTNQKIQVLNVEFVKQQPNNQIEDQQQNLNQNQIQNQNQNWAQNLSSQDINSLQKLTYHKFIGGISQDSSYQADLDQQSQLYSKHVWELQNSNSNNLNKNSVFEIQYSKPVSLVNLDIQCNFSTISDQNRGQNIRESLLKNFQINSTNFGNQGFQIQGTDDNLEDSNQNLQLQQSNNLSQNLQNFTFLQQISENQQVENNQQDQLYIPVNLVQFQGGVFKSHIYPSQILTPNKEKFVSNYPETGFVFEHLGGRKINVDKVTIHSSLKQRSAGYPIGFGLIFTSDSLANFDHAKYFNSFTSKQDYLNWRKQRLLFSKEIDSWEPVGCFEFQEPEADKITVVLDFRRSAQYIFIKPLNLRQVPKDFTKHYGIESQEISFIGVQGQILTDGGAAQKSQIQSHQILLDGIQNINQEFLNNLSLEITKDGQSWEKIENYSENHSFLNQILPSISKYQINRPHNLQKIVDFYLQNGISLDFLSKITLQPRQLTNSLVQGVRIIFNSQNLAQNYISNRISIQSIGSVDPEIKNVKTFEIRSALLDQQNYEILNKKLVESLVDPKKTLEYRKNVQKLLSQLMKKEEKLVGQILSDLKIREYIELNILAEKNENFSEVHQFLKNFVANPEFCQEFQKKILKNIIEILPNIIQNQNCQVTAVGVNGIFALLNWSYIWDQNLAYVELVSQIGAICRLISQNKNKNYSLLRQNYEISDLAFERDMFLGNSYSNTIQNWQKQKNQNLLLSASQQVAGIDSRISSQRSQTSRRIVVDLMNKHAVKDIYLCFGKNLTSLAKFQLNIWAVEEECQNQSQIQNFEQVRKTLIHSKNYPIHLFLQLANISQETAYINIFPSNERLEALGLTNFQVSTRYLIFQLNWTLNAACVHASEGKSVPSMDIIPEIYGDYLGPCQQNRYLDNLFTDFKESQVTHLKELKISKDSKKYQKFQVDNTIHLGTTSLTLYDSLGLYKIGDQICVPMSSNADSNSNLNGKIDEGLETHLVENIRNLDEKLQIQQDTLAQKLHEAVSSKNKTEISKICQKIDDIQLQKLKLSQKSQVQQQNGCNKNSLYFLYDMAAKIATFLKKIKPLQQSQNQKLTQISFQIFETFLIHEEGKIHKQLTQLLEQVLIPNMSETDWQQFVFKVIKIYLQDQQAQEEEEDSQQSQYSHSKIVQLLNKLSIPLGEVLAYLAQKLKIKLENIPESPMIALQQEDSLTLQACLTELLRSGFADIPLDKYDPTKVEHPGTYCFNCCFNRPIQGARLKCANCPNLDCCSKKECYQKHIKANPNHIFVIIQEPLPLAPEKKVTQIQPLLQKTFQFEQSNFKLDTENLVHHHISCDNCGNKQIKGIRYMCANCEEHNICQQCYDKKEHNKVHVFLQFDRIQKATDAEKNPVILVPQLDPLLYPLKSQTITSESQKRISKGLSREISREPSQDDVELKPHGMKRSISQPDEQLVKKKYQTKTLKIIEEETVTEFQTVRLDYEDSLIVAFQIAVQTSENAEISQQDKIELLISNFELLIQIMKLCSMEGIMHLIKRSDKDFFKLLFNVLKQQDQVLVHKFVEFLNNIIQPKNAPVKMNETQLNQLSAHQKQRFLREKNALNQLRLYFIYYLQNLLQWIIDYAFNSQQSSNLYTQILREQIPKQQWLEHVEFVLSFLLNSSEKIRQNFRQMTLEKSVSAQKQDLAHSQQSQLQNQSQQGQNNLEDEEDDDDVFIQPPQLEKAFSVKDRNQIILDHNSPQKSQKDRNNLINRNILEEYISKAQGTTFSFKTAVNLISLLLADNTDNKKNNNLLMKKGYNFSQSPEIWKLIFKALTKVKPYQIIEQKLFKNIIQCFFMAYSEVQNLVLRDLLTMTQNIIEQQHGQQNQVCQQILYVVFECLDEIYEKNSTSEEEKNIKYQLLIGLLDVLITKQSPKPTKFYTESQVNAHSYAKFDKLGANFLLDKSSEFLISFANPGGRDGILMANQNQLTKLQIADDLLRLVVSSNVCEVLLQDVEKEDQVQQQLQKLLSWYLMNRTHEKNNTSPGVEYMKSISQTLLVFFTKISEYNQCTKICLTELITSLKSTDQILLEFYKKQKISSYTTLSFAERICKSLEELFDIWVNNDELAQHVAFDIQGFEYLLEKMGINDQIEADSEHQSPQKPKKNLQQQQQQIQKRADIFAKLKSHYSEIQTQVKGLKNKKQLYGQNNDSSQNQNQCQDQNQNQNQDLDKIKKEEEKIQFNFGSQTGILKDEEIATSVSVINQPGQNLTGAPTDWAQNKKGVRSSKVVECKMQGDYYNEFPLVIRLKEPVEIKSLCLGFNCIDTISSTKVLGIPQNVLLEGGLSLDEMFSLGKLQQLDDEGFVNFSVKTFTKNFETIKSNQDGKTQVNLEKSLSTIQNHRVQFLRFRLSRPQISCVDGLSALYGKNFKNIVLQVSFLSISGYYVSKLTENVKSKIISTQQGSALQTLGKLCNQSYQGMLRQVANDKKILEKFKSSFQVLSDLLVIYENWLSPLILGVASHNQQMGDWIISNFLRLDRQQQHAKLVCEIILGNQTYSLARINTVLAFILDQFKTISINAGQGDIRQLNKYFQSALPFIQNLSNAIIISAQDLSLKSQQNQLNVNLNQEDCKNFIELFVIFKDSSYRMHIVKLLCVLLFAPKPYGVENQEEMLNYTLNQLHQIIENQKQENYNKLQIYEVIQALVIGGEGGIQWLLKNEAEKLNFYIDELINQFQEKKPYSTAKFILNLLVQVSQQKDVKSVIIQQKLHMKVFDNIKNYDPKVLNMVHDHIDKDSIKLIVQFLNNSILGNQENEKKFAEVLTNDIVQLSQKQDMKYVQNILMPLLNAEHTLPICFHGLDDVNNRWLSDPSTILQYSKKLKKQQITQISLQTQSISTKNQENNNNDEQNYINTLQSTCFNQVQKDKFVENLKFFAGKTNLKNKLDHSRWKLAYTQNQDQDSGIKATIKNNVLLKAPFLIIMHGKVENVQTSVGIFSTSSMSTYGDYGEYKIPQSKDNFFFYYTDKYQIHFETDQSTSLGCFFEEVDTSIIILNQGGQERILISYSLDEKSDAKLKISEMTIVDKDKSNFPSELPTSQFVFEKCEYWVLQEDKSLEKLKEQSQKETSEKISIIQPNQLLPQQFYHPSSLQYYRQQNVYQIPSQLDLKKVLQMLQAKGKYLQESEIPQIALKNRKNQQKLALSLQISEIESNDQGLIDLEYNALQMFEAATLSKQQKLQIQENPASYIPKMTIFDAFQEHGGVEKIIETILEQTSKWKNQTRAQNWKVYVMELKSFSALPHFFGLFMKNNECVQLLFQLMAGLPDVEEKDQKDKKSEIDWEKEEQKAVKYSYEILGDVFKDENDSKIRQFAYDNNFIQSILERMTIVSKEKVREFQEDESQDQKEEIVLKKKISNDDGKKEIRKKKGLGYGSDQTGDNKKWDVDLFIQSKKNKSEQLKSLLDIILKFLSFSKWDAPSTLLETLIQSSLLPMIENALNNSLVDMSKEIDLMFTYFKLLRILSKHKILMPLFFQLDPRYIPRQPDAIMSLMDRARDLAKIYKQVSQTKENEVQNENDQDKLAQEILDTHEIVSKAYQIYNDEMFDYDEQDQEEEMKKILNMDLLQKYRTLLQDLRFDYVSMKGQNNIYDHHYKSYITNSQPQSKKLVRLAQELADISTGLPIDHTNSIFARCDSDRVDVMKVCIMGSNGTPYGHGAYIFDVFFEDSYPDTPPKVNLSTTGSGQVRFNPNLYSCGKVCLSLLGTWRGVASENWDAKISTLLQVLVSIQSIIMAEEVYFNEPGHEHEAGTVQGEKYNEAYSNIVRYANIKFAMVEQIKNPPKGFETIIKRHFYLKKDEILEECEKWLKYAKTREADYKSGLISSHNSKWCQEFQKSKDRYEKMLGEAIDELKIELNKLEPPSFKELKLKKTANKKKKSKEQKQINIEKDGVENLDEIDITYEKEDKVQPIRELDINDEKVKDRWSRYIGAMGIDAVAKQSKCSIFLSGINTLGLEISKNIILGGVKRFTIHDSNNVTYNDMAGQFYVSESDIGKNRAQVSVSKLQQLNYYVKVDTCENCPVLPKNEEDIEKQLKLNEYNIVILIDQDYETVIAINNYCRKKGIKFMNADLNGPFAKLFNDFGDNFEVIDKNGEDPVECMISGITNEENGVVTLLPGLKHPYEDGDTVIFREVEGMDSLDTNKEPKSINGTIHKIQTINSNSFKIGDTKNYSPYIRNGLVKNIKVPVQISFKSFEDTYQQEEIPFDENMNIHDFMKFNHSKLLHICYNALDEFKISVNPNLKSKNLPRVWNLQDMAKFSEIAMKIAKKYFEQPETEDNIEKVVKLFAFSCGSQFAPLGAFMGGYISQEIIKAITGKYRPTNQYFYTDCIEVLPELPKEEADYEPFIKKLQIQPQNNRLDGIRQCVGSELMEKIQYSRIFMIGCGAIGCELLKNFAMISLFTGQQQKDKKQGLLTITDPDHIETSNLNRQFLFREKHLRKPKSSTGAAVALGMNPLLKGHINARLDKVHEGTVNIYSDEFFQGLTMVTNALDNVQARRYVDLRCVKNKIPLLDSGTLGPKGHVQVVIPHQTESYGSQQDPGNDDGEIPHCTLKMFPEETLHCVEWSKDKFGKLFTLRPKAILKIVEDDNYQPAGTQDLKTLRETVKLLKNRPKNFDDCVFYATKKFFKYFRNDIRQLLYTYPPDMKTKDGEPFWKLPKRPPQEASKIDPENQLHCAFIASVAVMRAKIFKIALPENYRSAQVRTEIAKKAAQINIPDFKPSEAKAKEITSEVQKDEKKEKEENKEDQDQEEEGKENQENEENENLQDLEEEVTNLVKELQDIKKNLPQENLKPKKEEHNLLQPEDFEKDEDQNGHIDYIYALANMRSCNYKLEPMDWLQVKLKAGRIVPALATTTAAIAALQTIELVKILKNEKTENMKNAFLNLAVPILQLSEPGAVQKIKLHDDLSVTLWDQWEIQNAVEENITLKQMFDKLKEKYKLLCHDVFLGNKCLYSSMIMNMKGKEKENESALNTELIDLLDPEEDQKYADLTITFSNLNSNEILAGTPPVRVFFN